MFSKQFIRLLARSNVSLKCARLKGDATKGLLFFEPKVQELLQKLATPDLEKAFPVRKTGEKLKPPEYKFMTDEELNAAVKKAEERSKQWLQMPPVIDPIVDQEEIIAEDPALDGFDTDRASYVFTDITFGIKDEDRLIVVREPDGTLKHANWEQRLRMTETYSPRTGREHTPPAMFTGEYLESLLERKEYKFILDRACTQYEPNDPDYVRITTQTYTAVANKGDFSLLYGTRHFGSMLFFLVFTKQVEALLLDNLQNDKLEDALSVIHLYHMIHPDCATASTSAEGVDLVKAFIAQEISRSTVLELALQTCLERLREKKVQSQQIEEAHGIRN